MDIDELPAKSLHKKIKIFERIVGKDVRKHGREPRWNVHASLPRHILLEKASLSAATAARQV
jgi:hypothetical protein